MSYTLDLIAQVEFPKPANLTEWPSYFGGNPWDDDGASFFALNKIGLISLIAMALPLGLFFLAGTKKALVPRGVQTIAESAVDFIKDIIDQTIGPDGKPFLPLLLSFFTFIFVGNFFEVIPTFQMPANARMANPLILALITFVTFIAVGIKHQGLFTYFKNTLIIPGLPFALHFLVVPIEFLSTFLIRPFSHAVRLFANMLAGHILLVTFGVLCIALFAANPLAIVLPFSFAMLVALTAFEMFVAFLQAYIFTLLAGVYIGGAMHPDH
jgi:F-type H+-transporting ATPase subunit a